MHVEKNTKSNAAAVREEMIRQRAYEIWEGEGNPKGRESEHWDQAAREVDGALGDTPENTDSNTPEPTGQDNAGEADDTGA